MTRSINSLVIHCSATKEGKDVSANTIKGWHINPKYNKTTGLYKYKGKIYSKEELPPEVKDLKGNGWSDIGYHYVIGLDGVLEDGRPNQVIGAHAKGHNRTSLGICLVGGLGKDMQPKITYTIAQMKTLKALVKFLRKMYDIDDSNVAGHRDLGALKACPCFDVKTWMESGELID
ncbi:MAG: lysozyme [Helicobacteraceae bacterium]|nr:lysozyme [Helicobacteraceae bacterium]